VGWKHYRDQKRAYEAANAPAPAGAPPQPAPSMASPVVEASKDERPERLH